MNNKIAATLPLLSGFQNPVVANDPSLRPPKAGPDAICGITPIELMLEINEVDQSRPAEARTPDKGRVRSDVAVPGELLGQAVAAGASANAARQTPLMTPIETPLTFSGFHENVLR